MTTDPKSMSTDELINLARSEGMNTANELASRLEALREAGRALRDHAMSIVVDDEVFDAFEKELSR